METLKIVDMLTINEGEAYMPERQRGGSGGSHPQAGPQSGGQARRVRRPPFPNGVFSAPALPLRTVKDPTGAGDTFAGGLMGYLAKQGVDSDLGRHEAALREAVIHGCVMASFTVEDFGFTNLMRVTPGMIEERYRSFVNMTRF